MTTSQLEKQLIDQTKGLPRETLEEIKDYKKLYPIEEVRD
jgi:hypothetical protein